MGRFVCVASVEFAQHGKGIWGETHKRNRVGFCKILVVNLFVWSFGEMFLLLRRNLPCDLLSMASLCSRYTT